VLEGEVEVGHAGSADGVDQPVGEVARVQVQQPDPGDARRHRVDQRDDRALPHPLVPAERGQVLGDQHDLGCAELVDLPEDGVDRA
jgi:hypothetical protein